MDIKYKKIISIIQENLDKVEFADFGEGVSDEWIKKAELRLGVDFPKSYKWWLRNYCGGEIHGEEIFSIYELDFDTVVGGDVVYINELNRKRNLSKKSELVIQENDQGKSYYFDLSVRNHEGDCPIFIKPGNVKYARDFVEFLEKKINE